MSELARTLEEIARRGHSRNAATVVGAAFEQFDQDQRPVPHVRRRAIAQVAVAAAAAFLVTLVVRWPDDDRRSVTAAAPDNGARPTAMTVLLVGLDRRVGSGAEEPPTERAFDLLLLRVNKDARSAAALSVPGDVATADGSRLAEAHRKGSEALRSAVSETVGVPIDASIELDQQAFASFIDRLGGVSIRIGAPTRDPLTDLELPSGCVALDGPTAALYVRSSHLQSFEDGRWHADPTVDIGRIHREHALLLALRRQVGKTLSNQQHREQVTAALAEHATGDGTTGLAAAEVVIDWLRSDTVPTTLLLPVVTTRRDDAALYEPTGDAEATIARFTSDGPQSAESETADCP